MALGIAVSSTWHRRKWLVGAAASLAAMLLSTLAGAAGPAAPAPAFSLPARSGKAVALAELKGQVVMLNFWASWCGPCRKELPLLESMYKRYSKQGFTLLGVNVEAETADAEAALNKLAVPLTFPILWDKESKVSQLYNVSAMPSSVFIDRKGNVRYVHRGFKEGDENEYLNQIRALLKE
jgi:peroxiredoxin